MRRILYLLKRGPKPPYHRAPFHPVIVCDQRAVATWEAGWTGDRSWMWEAAREKEPYGIGGGWLLVKWEGLNIDYGHLIRGCTLPDGTDVGFHHRHGRALATWALLCGAVWWSSRPLPESLRKHGIIEAPDEFSLERIQKEVPARALAAAPGRLEREEGEA